MSSLPPLRVVFMGTPDFAVPALEALIAAPEADVVCVYSQPPRPKGRGKQVQPSPVHLTAEKAGIEIRTPKSLRRSESAQAEFAALKADLAVVAAYGLLLPKSVLDAPRFACVNIHASLLPRWRGAAPIQHAILAGDRESGISLMRMEEGLDTGPVYRMKSVPITDTATASTLHDALSALGGEMIGDFVRDLAKNGALPTARAQDGARATHAPMLTKADGYLDWQEDAEALGRRARAMTPWPGAWCKLQSGKRLKVLEAKAVSDFEQTGPPGTLLDRDGHVACGNGALKLLRVQPENARAMDAAAAVNGGYLTPGERLLSCSAGN